MSKTTIAIIAAISAGTGAAVTATMYSLRSDDKRAAAATAAKTITTTTTTSTSTVAPAAPGAVPASQIFATPPAAVVGLAPVDPAGLFEYGFPGPVADIATRSALISSFDRRLRNPHWVVEHITPASLAQRDGDRKHSVFVEDAGVPDKFRAKLKDYSRSGYDRGHQVPAADAKWSQAAMDETFFLTNMCPQVGEGFNRDYWAHFEDFCRRLTQRYPSVRIVTGPLYLPRRDPADGKRYVRYEVIGNPPSVSVPTHFYKVIFAEDGAVGGNVAVGAFVLPNAPIPNEKPLADFEVPVEAVERASGLEFASKLPVQRRRRLCADTTCAIVVRDYADRQKAFAREGSSAGSSQGRLGAPQPRSQSAGR
jgi:endonuclease G